MAVVINMHLILNQVELIDRIIQTLIRAYIKMTIDITRTNVLAYVLKFVLYCLMMNDHILVAL